MVKINKGKVIGPEINIAVSGQPPSVTHQSGTWLVTKNDNGYEATKVEPGTVEEIEDNEK